MRHRMSLIKQISLSLWKRFRFTDFHRELSYAMSLQLLHACATRHKSVTPRKPNITSNVVSGKSWICISQNGVKCCKILFLSFLPIRARSNLCYVITLKLRGFLNWFIIIISKIDLENKAIEITREISSSYENIFDFYFLRRLFRWRRHRVPLMHRRGQKYPRSQDKQRVWSDFVE